MSGSGLGSFLDKAFPAFAGTRASGLFVLLGIEAGFVAAGFIQLPLVAGVDNFELSS